MGEGKGVAAQLLAGRSGRFELGRLDSDGADIPVPQQEHAHRATEGLADHESLQVRHVLDRMIVYLENDVARAESGACRRTSGHHLQDLDTERARSSLPRAAAADGLPP